MLSTELLLLAGVLFCTVAGYFALQPMMAWAHGRGFGLMLIEVMPLSKWYRPLRQLPAT